MSTPATIKAAGRLISPVPIVIDTQPPNKKMSSIRTK